MTTAQEENNIHKIIIQIDKLTEKRTHKTTYKKPDLQKEKIIGKKRNEEGLNGINQSKYKKKTVKYQKC